MKNLQSFLTDLEPHTARPMVFEIGKGQRVPVGYHVTEFKALEYHTVDCGGMEHKFSETVIELWRTALEPNREYISVGKFLSIYNKVSPKVNFVQESELVFLYASAGEPAARYSIAKLEDDGQNLVVYLEPDGVRCKSAERKADALLGSVAGGCCTPTNSSLVCC